MSITEKAVMKSIETKTKGNSGALLNMAGSILGSLKKHAGSEEAFGNTINEILEKAVASQGEEHREFYSDLLGKLAGNAADAAAEPEKKDSDGNGNAEE